MTLALRASSIVIALVAATAAATAGCKPKDAAADTGCAAGATKVAAGGFCISLPPGATPSPPFTAEPERIEYGFRSDIGSITVSVSTGKAADPTLLKMAYEDLGPSEKEKATSPIKAKADLPGGGKYLAWFDPDQKRIRAESVLTKTGMELACSMNMFSDKDPPPPEMLEVCKTIRFLP